MSEAAAKALVDTNDEMERWNQFLQQIAAGTPLPDACLAARVTSAEITLFTLSPLEAQRWADACLAAKRHRWSQIDLDEIFRRIAAGKEVEQALVEVRGTNEDAGEFYELLDVPDLSERYATAQRARALRSAESLTAIADDDSKDTLDTLKGPMPNMANVQRSRLRIETRQALNSAWHPDRFSEKRNQVNVQVNVNFAERLEQARERAKVRGDKPKISKLQMARAVDAVFAEVPVEKAAAKPESVAEQPVAESKDLYGLDE